MSRRDEFTCNVKPGNRFKHDSAALDCNAFAWEYPFIRSVATWSISMRVARLSLVISVLFSAAFLMVLPVGSYAADMDTIKKVAYESIRLWMSGSDITPEEVFAPDYINHVDSPISAKAPSDRDIEALKKELAQFHAAFSEVHVTSSEQVAQGNLVATRVVISARHTGSFIGEKPTGTKVTYDSVEFTRVENGKIVETWVTWDKFGLYRQIGAIPNAK